MIEVLNSMDIKLITIVVYVITVYFCIRNIISNRNKPIWIVSFEHIYYDTGGKDDNIMGVFFSEKSANEFKEEFINQANNKSSVYGAQYYIHVSKHCIIR
jgi:hypothetical protein